jgi:hypothetical protein
MENQAHEADDKVWNEWIFTAISASPNNAVIRYVRKDNFNLPCLTQTCIHTSAEV